MKTILAATGIFVLALTGQTVSASAECLVSYTRTACAGQEATSYKKCDGNQSCVKTKKAASLEECQTAATKSCRNRRLNITKSKVITATWMGNAIQSPAGKDDFCLDYAKRDAEFNRCDQ